MPCLQRGLDAELAAAVAAAAKAARDAEAAETAHSAALAESARVVADLRARAAATEQRLAASREEATTAHAAADAQAARRQEAEGRAASLEQVCLIQTMPCADANAQEFQHSQHLLSRGLRLAAY